MGLYPRTDQILKAYEVAEERTSIIDLMDRIGNKAVLEAVDKVLVAVDRFREEHYGFVSKGLPEVAAGRAPSTGGLRDAGTVLRRRRGLYRLLHGELREKLRLMGAAE